MKRQFIFYLMFKPNKKFAFKHKQKIKFFYFFLRNEVFQLKKSFEHNQSIYGFYQ